MLHPSLKHKHVTTITMSRMKGFFVFLLCSSWFELISGRELKIGIIGGGISGLFSSRILRESGFKDITIIEKSHRVSPIIKSQKVYSNGKSQGKKKDLLGAIDMTANFIPTRSYVPNDINNGFNDIYMPLKKIYNDVEINAHVNMTLDYEDVIGWNLNTHKQDYGGYIYRYANEASQFIAELIQGCYLFLNIMQNTKSIQDVYRIGVTKKGETLYEWVKEGIYQG